MENNQDESDLNSQVTVRKHKQPQVRVLDCVCLDIQIHIGFCINKKVSDLLQQSCDCVNRTIATLELDYQIGEFGKSTFGHLAAAIKRLKVENLYYLRPFPLVVMESREAVPFYPFFLTAIEARELRSCIILANSSLFYRKLKCSEAMMLFYLSSYSGHQNISIRIRVEVLLHTNPHFMLFLKKFNAQCFHLHVRPQHTSVLRLRNHPHISRKIFRHEK